MRIFWLLLMLVGWISSPAQQTFRTFATTEVPASVLGQALGGHQPALVGRDVLTLFSNPATVKDSIHQISISYHGYLAGIGQSSVGYAKTWRGFTTFAGIQHMSYGKLMAYDATGAELGEFNAGETQVALGASKQMGLFRYGLNTRLIVSDLGTTPAIGLVWDLGGIFVHPSQQLTVGVAIADVGMMLRRYPGNSQTIIPVVRAGVTFKPEAMPVRFMVNINQLGRSEVEDSGTVQQRVFRKVSAGAEILIHKSVSVLAGWQYRRSAQIGSGITYGLEMRLRSISVVAAGTAWTPGKSTFACSIYKQLKI